MMLLLTMSIVGRLEVLNKLWKKQRDMAGTPTNAGLPPSVKRRSTVSRSSASSYDSNLIDIVIRRYRRNFEILEYCPEIENCIDVGRSLMLLTP